MRGVVPTGHPAEQGAADHADAQPRNIPSSSVNSRERCGGTEPVTSSGRPGKWSPESLRKCGNRAVARFPKPSDGLEPSTPSLPWQSGCAAEPVYQAKIPAEPQSGD